MHETKFFIERVLKMYKEWAKKILEIAEKEGWEFVYNLWTAKEIEEELEIDKFASIEDAIASWKLYNIACKDWD
jgi:hypothetical protein